MAGDPYVTLDVPKTASEAEIKTAYRKLVRTSHPDINPDDPEAEARFKAVSAAYDLLKDPETRARFDRGEIDATGAETAERTFYRRYAGQAENPYQSAGFGGAEDDPGDIFAEFLRRGQRSGGFAGSAGSAGGNFSMRGGDRRYHLDVPFLDAARGAKTRITLPDGAALEVTIPPGTEDGQTLRLRGKGSPGFGDGPPGDALITVSVADHPVFRREGNDIRITLPISIDEAVLGGKVAVPTIDGPVNLTVPKGASGGRTLRLRGRGTGREGGRGDQLVELRVVLPERIDEDLAAFMRDWRERHGYDPRGGMG
jgi:DnaJ-class molecular chaperone